MKPIRSRTPSTVDAHLVRLDGGLGNQMFQYAFGRTLRERTGFPVHYDARTLFAGGQVKGNTVRDYALGDLSVDVPFASGAELDYFGLQPAGESKFGLYSFASNLKTLGRRGRIVREKGFDYKGRVFSKTRTAKYFTGYWQSERYLIGIEDELRAQFQPTTALCVEGLDLKQRIEESGGACIHVRRGDFVSDDKTRKFHGYMDLDYYKSALNHLRQKGSFDYLFIFSDEPEWCRTNLRLPGNVEVVPNRLSGPNATHHLSLMASCSGFVIPNSTFGWWGAWLANVSGGLVVAPKNWFADKTIDTSEIVPKSWSRL